MPSFFDEPDAPADVGMDAADDRTLRLATHPLTEHELAALLRYQEAFLAIAEPSPSPDKLARAHDTERLLAVLNLEQPWMFCATQI